MRSITTRAAAVGTAVLLPGAAVLFSTASPSGADDRPVAQATMHNVSGQRIGKVVFIGSRNHATRARVELALPAGAPGLGAYHGLHIHAVGECVAPFTSAGSHWDDGTHVHGDHHGDLSSVLVTVDGRATAEFATDRFDVEGMSS